MNARAFTLLELMVVAAMVGILGTAATVSMSDSVRAARYREERDELSKRIVSARDNARERMRALMITSSSDGKTLTLTVAQTKNVGGTPTCVATAGFTPVVLKNTLLTTEVRENGTVATDGVCIDDSGRPLNRKRISVVMTGKNRAGTELARLRVMPSGVIEKTWTARGKEGATAAAGGGACAALLSDGTTPFCQQAGNTTHPCCEESYDTTSLP